MIKHSKLSKKVMIGAIVGSLAISGTALGAVKAYEKYIKVRFANIKLIVDGKTIQTKAEPFIYNGNVYAPVATIANGMDLNQRWDNSKPAVIVTKKDPNYPGGMPLESWQRPTGMEPRTETSHLFGKVDIKTYMKWDFDAIAHMPVSNTIVYNNASVELPKTAPDGSPLKFQILLANRYDGGQGVKDSLNSGSFACVEITNENKAYLTTYHFYDGKLTKGTSILINDDKYAYASPSGNQNLITVTKGSKIIKAVQYDFDSNREMHIVNVLNGGSTGTTTTPDTAK